MSDGIDFGSMPDGVTDMSSEDSTTSTEQALEEMASGNEEIQSLLTDMGASLEESAKYDKKMGRKGKSKPSLSDMLGFGAIGASAVYLGNIISGAVSKAKEKAKGFNLGALLEGGLGAVFGNLSFAGMRLASLGPMLSQKIVPILSKALPIASIVGGIVWAVIDGFKGFMKSGEWGVSKVSGAIGGFFAGTGEGLKGAFANAGKWALIGAGIGSVVPVVGTIAGGLIGAAFGGILGFFGGKKIAQGLDKIGEALGKLWDQFANSGFGSLLIDTLKNVFQLIISPFKGIFDAAMNIWDKLKAIWGDDERSVMSKLGATFFQALTAIPQLLFGGLKGLFSGIGTFFKNLFVDQKDPATGKIKKSLLKRGGEVLLNIGKGILSFVGSIWDGMVKFFMGLPQTIQNIVGNISQFAQDVIFPAISEFFSGFMDGVQTFIDGSPVLSTIQDIILHPIDNIKKIFEDIKTQMELIFQDPVGFVTGLWESITSAIGGFFTKITDFFSFMGALFDPRQGGGPLKGLEAIGQLAFNPEAFTNAFGRYRLQRERERRGIDVNDAIIRPDGSVITTHPDDTIIATKNEPAFFSAGSGAGGNNDVLIAAISQLSQAIAEYKPQLVQQTNVLKGFTNDPGLMDF